MSLSVKHLYESCVCSLSVKHLYESCVCRSLLNICMRVVCVVIC